MCALQYPRVCQIVVVAAIVVISAETTNVSLQNAVSAFIQINFPNFLDDIKTSIVTRVAWDAVLQRVAGTRSTRHMFFASTEANVKEKSETTVKEESQATAKMDSQATVKEESKATIKKDSKATFKEDTAANAKEKSKTTVKEDNQANVKENSEVSVKKEGPKSRHCALGLKWLRQRTENYKGPEEYSNPFIQGKPPLPR